MLKCFVKIVMIIDKVHEKISYKQRNYLEMYIHFNTQKRNEAEKEFRKKIYKLLNYAFSRKTKQNVRNSCKIEFIKKDHTAKFIKHQHK